MAIPAGSLRHRVMLQQRLLVQDSNGDPVAEWTDVAHVWASIVPASVREFVNSQAQQSQIDARIVINYRAGINAQMRIVHRNNVYDIQGVLADPDSGLEYLTLPCKMGLIEPDSES